MSLGSNIGGGAFALEAGYDYSATTGTVITANSTVNTDGSYVELFAAANNNSETRNIFISYNTSNISTVSHIPILQCHTPSSSSSSSSSVLTVIQIAVVQGSHSQSLLTSHSHSHDKGYYGSHYLSSRYVPSDSDSSQVQVHIQEDVHHHHNIL